jgi:predicted pyridoxine 5'-phosphate oxidase superfamily flavin-nucleotide-binding protein
MARLRRADCGKLAGGGLAVNQERPMLTEDMKRIIREQPLGYVASVGADGAPRVAPKATFVVVDDTTIAYGDIRSPNTTRNVRGDPRVEVNFIDPFVRKGYRFAGTAVVTERGEAGFDALFTHFQHGALASRMRAIVTIKVTRALPLASPVYDDGRAEVDVRRNWVTRFRKLQPNGRYEE